MLQLGEVISATHRRPGIGGAFLYLEVLPSFLQNITMPKRVS
jgi:hypothetical protein